jgi:mRNA-degrading endonuclease RelE of RelBE toxin-antitoxin system
MKQAIKGLQKRFPHVVDDVERAALYLQTNPSAGDVVPGSRGCRKLRIPNTDARKGTRGGYRLIYFLVDEPTQTIHLLLIYSKNTREDIPTPELVALLKDAGLI